MRRPLKAGDIIDYDFTSESRGRETRGRRPALVVSSEEFNKKLELIWICPISRGPAEKERNKGYAVSLMGACRKTDGAVHVHQLRVIDLKINNPKTTDKIDENMLHQIHDRIITVLGIDPDDLPN